MWSLSFTQVTLERDHCRACNHWYPGCTGMQYVPVNLYCFLIILDVTMTHC